MPYRDLFRKILFCTDFNTDAQKAFLYALNVAAGNRDSELIIFHTIPEPDAQFWKSYIYEVENVDQRAQLAIEEKINATYRNLIPDTQRWCLRCVTGNVGEQILKAAEEELADIIIIGRGAGNNIINRLLGNFTEKVVRRTHCPVLVVPEEGQVFGTDNSG